MYATDCIYNTEQILPEIYYISPTLWWLFPHKVVLECTLIGIFKQQVVCTSANIAAVKSDDVRMQFQLSECSHFFLVISLGVFIEVSLQDKVISRLP